MFSPHSSSHFQKIGISSLIFLSGIGSVLAAPLSTPVDPDGNTYVGGKFSLYFKNIADTDCTGLNVLTGFNNLPGNNYLIKECTSIGPIIGAFFAGQPTAPLGTAITGFNPSTGAPIFGNASQWVGSVPGNIYYTGGSVGIRTNVFQPGAALQVNGSIRALGGIPENADSSTRGYAFDRDGDTGLFSQTGGALATSQGLGMYINNVIGLYIKSNAGNPNVAIGTNTVGNNEKLRIETPNNYWATSFSRGNALVGGIHTNAGILTIQNLSGALMYFSGVNMNLMTSGNVGIGTTSPLTKLQVGGEISSTSANALRMIQGNYGVFWRNDGADTWLLATNPGDPYGSWSTFRPFRYNFASGSVFLANNALTALSTGNVGIGTTSPLTKLQVGGEISSTSANTFRAVQGNYGTFWRNNGSDLYLLSTNSADQYGTYNTYRPFRYNFASGSVFLAGSAFTAMNNGNIGINNTNPTEKLTVSGNAIVSGNVGIGTTTPDHKLVVASASNAVANFISSGGNAYLRLSIYNDIAKRIELANRDGRTALWNPQTGDAFNILHTNGNIGIGTATPSSKLDVKGEITSRYLNDASGIYSQFRALWGNYGFMIRNDGSNTYFLLTSSGDPQGTWNTLRPFIINNSNGNVAINTQLTVNGNMYANNYYYTSDKRLKKDIVPIVSPLEKIKALSGYTFAWKDTGVKSVGLIAQEVEKVFPELIGETQTASGMTIKTVQYGNLVAPLIESVKELSRLHDQDQKDITDLKSEVEQMKKDLESLRSQIKK